MGNDCDIVLTRKDGSVRNFYIYGRPAPKAGEVVSLPVDGYLIKARISEPLQESDVTQSAGHADAVEV
jgi:hypothetical protein